MKKTCGHSVRRLHYIMEQIQDREMLRWDLTSSQGRIVGYLFHCKQPPCGRDLEQFFGLSHPTVSGLLTRMEAKDFITLRPDEKDKRIKRIYPTEKCIACAQSIGACIRDNEERMYLGFSEEEKAVFQNLLQRATENLREKLQESNQ